MKKKILFFLLGVLVSFVSIFTVFSILSNYNDFVRFDNRDVKSLGTFVEKDSLGINTRNLEAKYSSNRSFETAEVLFSDGVFMSSAGLRDEAVFGLLWNTYTDSLRIKVGEVNNLDSLNLFVSFGEDIQSLKFTHAGWAADLSWIADFWFDYSAKRISQLIAEGKVSKYSYKALSLKRRLARLQYNVNFETSSTEKVVYNFTSGNYAYLYNRILLRTTWVQKILLAGFMVLLITPGLVYVYSKFKK